MMNLFSVFDPSSKMFNANWMSIMFPFFILFIFWIISHPIILMKKIIIMFLHKELKMIFSKTSFYAMMFTMSLMLMIMLMNALGLIPYIFTPTSHIMVTLSLALPAWLMTILYGWIHQLKLSLAHLVPLGTPIFLMPMMVLIETISLLIRPVTLSIRLAANMVAGHLLITLVSSKNYFYWNLLYSLGHMSLNILEMAVALIQAYVFMILCSLYISEVK